MSSPRSFGYSFPKRRRARLTIPSFNPEQAATGEENPFLSRLSERSSHLASSGWSSGALKSALADTGIEVDEDEDEPVLGEVEDIRQPSPPPPAPSPLSAKSSYRRLLSFSKSGWRTSRRRGAKKPPERTARSDDEFGDESDTSPPGDEDDQDQGSSSSELGSTSGISVSSLLIRTDCRPPTPFKTKVITVLAGQLLFSLVLCLPLLFISIFIPLLNLVTIPLSLLILGVLFYNVAFLAYLTLAQTDPPAHVRLPFLPYFDVWLCARVNLVVFQWIGIAFRLGPKLVTDWCVRRVLAARDPKPDWIRTDVHYGSPRPGKRLDVYRGQPSPGAEFKDIKDLFGFSSPPSIRKMFSDTLTTPPISVRTAPAPAPSSALRITPSEEKLAPIVIFIASPNLGPFTPRKWMYESLGRNMSSLMGYCVVIPDITWFPEGKAKEMVEDVRRVMKWVRENGRRYGGDIERIYLMGHSLGATLALLTVLQEAVVVSRDMILTHDPDAEISNGLRKIEIYAQEATTPKIQGMILLAPICDVNSHIYHEAERGVSHISKVRRVLGPSHTTAMFHSPAHVLHASRNVVNVGLLPPKVLFIHGGLDEEVHRSQSEQMKEMMRGVGVVDARVRVYPVGHLDVVTSLMMKMDEPASKCIQEEVMNFIPL